MTISLMDAIKAVKTDEHWLRKVIIGGIFAALILIAECFMQFNKHEITVATAIVCIVGIIGAVLYMGFYVLSGNKMIHSDNYEMAEWGQPNIMLVGLKSVVGYLLWIAVIHIAIMLFSIVSGILVFVIYGFLSLFSYSNTEIVPILMTVFTIVLAIAVVLYFLQYLYAMSALYLKTLKFESIFCFKKHFNIVKNNFHATWSLIGKWVLLSLLIFVVDILLAITIIGLILVPFVDFYFAMATVILLAQYAKQINIGQYIE